MNDPIRIAPGIKKRLEARTRMTTRNMIVSPLVTIAKLDGVSASELLSKQAHFNRSPQA